jgi:hypothetical protein
MRALSKVEQATGRQPVGRLAPAVQRVYTTREDQKNKFGWYGGEA